MNNQYNQWLSTQRSSADVRSRNLSIQQLGNRCSPAEVRPNLYGVD